MFKHTKYRKKIKITYIASATAIGFAMLVAFPWMHTHAKGMGGYYVATLNGVEIGSASNESDIQDALKAARLRVNAESDEMVYIEQNLDIKAEDRITGKRMDEKQLENKMYETLKSESDKSDDKQKAYVVNINDFTVTLGSEEEVIKLLSAAKSQYDADNKFQIGLVEENANAYAYLTAQTYTSQLEAKNTGMVMASADGVSDETQNAAENKEVAEDNADGVKSVSFAEDIQVLETYTDKSEISDLQTAIDEVTKDKEESQVYVVAEGDCLSSIAEKYNLYMAEILGMNPGLTADSVIGIGDQITVTVPKPELSVIVKEQQTYQETYNAEVQYVYNDNKYTNETTVLNEGTPGQRQVTALVTYQNGSETSREIVSESVIQESTPRVIEQGTMVPPTFIKPLAGGTFTSGFGQRWGRQHKGIDWACPIGTAINASCGGRVVRAGWFSGYGYCVEIAHSNGTHTRYGHLSKVLVSVGDTVAQGDRVALSGNTGDSTGPHVHFEIIVGGTAVDPLSYLN